MKLNKRIFIVMIDDTISTYNMRKVTNQIHYEWKRMTRAAIIVEGLIELKKRVKGMPDGELDSLKLFDETGRVMAHIGDEEKYLMDVVVELYNGGEINDAWEY